MFSGFAIHDVGVVGVRIHARVGGKGPPVLLLHGYPQTHVMWGPVAEALAQSHTVVAADLRGYGDSEKPASETDHSSYGKRAMAADQAELMKAEETLPVVMPNWHYLHIHNDVIPALKDRGVTDEQLTTMLVDNPRKIFENQGAY
jgi:alpha-beta hydrolase superfamily lysophospholipase